MKSLALISFSVLSVSSWGQQFDIVPVKLQKIAPIGTIPVGENLYMDMRDITNEDWYSYLSFPFNDSLHLPVFRYDSNAQYKFLKQSLFSPATLLTDISTSELAVYCEWRSAIVNHGKSYFTTGIKGCKGNKYYGKFKKADPENKYRIVFEPAPKELLAKKNIKGLRCIAKYVRNQ